MTKDIRIDKYIQHAEPFTQPILKHLRNLVHTTCSDVEETIKWGFPHFDYRGEMMCSMASFKQHVAFGFGKESLIDGVKNAAKSKDDAMRSLGRITNMADLPSDTAFRKFINEAMRFNEEGIKVKKVTNTTDRTLEVSDYFTDALKRNNKAQETFDNFSLNNKKDYVEWLLDAKKLKQHEKNASSLLLNG